MYELLSIIFLSILIVSAFEVGLHFLIRHLRKDFQWLITAEDKLPSFSTTVLNRFFTHGFDPELGWVRKPNTQAQESGGTVGEMSKQYKKSAYHINYRGARLNPVHEDLPLMISTYGDSFVFSRQVNDNETWQWFLSNLTQTNVLNFGVGNYGIDQSLLRLKREYEQNRTPIVIMGVVPETIVRILSVWRHYSEYGNTLAFKPRFELENGKLTLVRNVIDHKDKFLKIHKYLHYLNDQDYFYANKFSKDILYFPYLISLSRSARRNVPLIAALLNKRLGPVLGKTKTNNNRPWQMVLERNFEIVRDLYQSPDTINLFLKILEDFAAFGKQHGFHPVFLLMPYLHDMLYIKDHSCYYANFVSQAKEILHTIDLTQPLMSSGNLNNLYSNDLYGGHFSAKGNEFLSNFLFEELCGLFPMAFHQPRYSKKS
jgi:hypothetical protein